MVKLVRKQIINEAKQVGTLYHICSLESLFKYIIKNDVLSGSGNFNNWLLGGRTDVVSFTRDKRYIVSTDNTRDTSILFSFTVDGDKLSENHKIIPYNDFAFYEDGWKVDFSEEEDGYTGKTESEEVVVGEIKNFSSFVLGIRYVVVFSSLFPPFNDYEKINKTYNMLISCKSYLEKFPCSYGKEMSPYLQDRNKLYIKKTPNSIEELINIIGCLKDIYNNKQISDKSKQIISEYFTPYAKYRLIRPILSWENLSDVLPKEIFKKNFIDSRLRKTGDKNYYNFSSKDLENLLNKYLKIDPTKKDIIDSYLNNRSDKSLTKLLSHIGSDLASFEFDSVKEPDIYTLGISNSRGNTLCKYLLADFSNILTEKELINYINHLFG